MEPALRHSRADMARRIAQPARHRIVAAGPERAIDEEERLVQTNTLQIFLTCRKFAQLKEIFPPINCGQFAKSPEIPVDIEIGPAPAIRYDERCVGNRGVRT